MSAVINDTGILVVLIAVIALFGASRIPKLARNLGEASKEFKKAQDDDNRSEPVATPKALTERAATVTLTRDELDALVASKAHQQQAPATQTGV